MKTGDKMISWKWLQRNEIISYRHYCLIVCMCLNIFKKFSLELHVVAKLARKSNYRLVTIVTQIQTS